MSRSSLFVGVVGSVVSFHGTVISSVHDCAFPETYLKVMSWRPSHWSNQPLYALKWFKPRPSAYFTAFSFGTRQLVCIPFSHIFTNHLYRAWSGFSYLLVFNFYVVGLFPLSKVLIFLCFSPTWILETLLLIYIFIIWLSPLAGLYAKWRMLISCPAVQ